MRFQPGRGGHAPGHLRDALLECLDAGSSNPWYQALADDEVLWFRNEPDQEEWSALDLKQRALWLIGQLWNCTDVLPGEYCEDLGIPRGSSYAVAVRNLRSEMT